jgi:gliding motility-associated-like protein
LDESGYYQICLDAHGETCEDVYCEFVRIYKSGTEDCQNGIDDDGDELIDLFDNECQCSPSSYQAICPVDCLYIPDSFPNISLKLKWESELVCDFDNINGNLTCGDIDGDGTVEVVSSTLFGMTLPFPPWGSSVGGIGILAGSDGHIINAFNFTPENVAFGSLNMGLIKDPVSNNTDIIFHDYNSNRIVRYDRFGNKEWESVTIGSPYGATINFADFNTDGIPELYLNRMIFNAETGKLLAIGKEGIGGNKIGSAFPYYAIAHSLAADLLPSPGLELAAGNTVYTVELNNLADSVGNQMIPIISNSLKDGLTGLADFDGDQQLDVVLVRSNDWSDGGGVSIWNPRTGLEIATGMAGSGGGIPAIGDLDGDCKPEIVVAFENQLMIYDYIPNTSLELRFTIPIKEGSGCTSVALFDFNLDGLLEIVYRDEENLYIINGYTGVILDSYPVFSGTYLEGPIIADINNDGSAEIIVSGSLSNNMNISILAFESGGKSWAPARSIWNQYGYHVTNVNDDLSIPKEPQNWAKQIPGTSNCSLPTCEGVYNNFMTQATYRTQEGCIQFPAMDIKVENLSYSCSPDSLTLCFSVENIGNGNFSNEPVFITAWESNPFQTNGSRLFVKQVTISLEVGEIDTICLTDLLVTGYDSIVLMVNDQGSVPSPYLYPANSFEECNYQNNLVNVDLYLPDLDLELGPDITKCNSAVITLTANSGFETYLWNDGSLGEQFSTSAPGLYFVQTTDVCHRIYTDSVQISVDEPDQINLGPDQTICPLETLEFTLPNTFDWIHWISTINIACDTCQSIQIASDTSYLLIALAGNGDCIVQDSVNIIIVETVTSETDQFICSTERFEFFGDSLGVSGTYSHLTQDCDSLFILNLSVGQVTTTDISEVFCDGDSIEIEGHWVSKAGSYIIELSDINGCDSLVNLSVNILPEYETFLVETICLGDSLQFGASWLYEAGTYSTMLQSESGCDSLINLELNVENEVIQEEVYTLCEGDSLYLKDHWVYDSGLYKDTLNQNDCNVVIESTVNFYPDYTFFDTASICGKDSIWVIDQWVITPGLYSKTLSTIFGCDSTLNVNVIEIPDYPLPTIEVDCEHSIVILNIAGDSTLHVSWDNGDNSHSTTYAASDSARWSISYDTICIRVFAIPLPEIPNASVIPVIPDTTISSGTGIGFDLGLDPNDWRIFWETDAELSCDSCSSIIISTESNTEVSVQLTHLESECTFKEGFRIFVSSDGEFYIPNVFSPNGDGINDVWTIGKSNPNIEFKSLEIFDRWGNQVANWKNTNLIQWDGLMKDKPLQSGVYAFVLKYSNPGHPSELKKGTVTLIR